MRLGVMYEREIVYRDDRGPSEGKRNVIWLVIDLRAKRAHSGGKHRALGQPHDDVREGMACLMNRFAVSSIGMGETMARRSQWVP